MGASEIGHDAPNPPRDLLLIPLYGSWLDWSRPLTPLAIGLQAGGALSNLLDRLFGGGVVDYLAGSAGDSRPQSGVIRPLWQMLAKFSIEPVEVVSAVHTVDPAGTSTGTILAE